MKLSSEQHEELPQLTKQQELELSQNVANIKAYLKTLSKKELIRTVLEQLDLYIGIRHDLKLALEDIKALRAQVDLHEQNAQGKDQG